MKLYPAAWKYSAYKPISIMMVLLGVFFGAVFLRYGAPVILWCMDAAVLLMPLWLWISKVMDRENHVSVTMDSDGILLLRGTQELFRASWDEVRDVQTCFGIRDSGRSRFSYNCYQVCISNQPLIDSEHFDARKSLNWLQSCPKEGERWVIYCNRGTKAECQGLIDQICSVAARQYR